MPVLPRDTIRELFRHMEWADAKVWHTVIHHAPALGDDTIRVYLMHLHTVQRLFLELWTRSPEEVVTPADEIPAALQADYVSAVVQPYYARVFEFIECADERVLTRSVAMPWLREFEQRTGKTFVTPTVAETMLQVVSHSTHHRGQVNARLRAVAAEPPLVDYIAWIWFGKPDADWQLAPA